MRRLVLAAALALLPAAAFAADDVMAGFYGNTVVTRSDLGESDIHYRPDHKFDGSAHNQVGSMDLSGTWQVGADGQLCRTYDTPPPGVTNPNCGPIAAHKVGDSWSYTADGQTRTVTLEAGAR